MIKVAAREMKQLLQVSWSQQARPYAVLRIVDVRQYRLLDLFLDFRQRGAGCSEGQVFEEHGKAIERSMMIEQRIAAPSP